MNNKSNSKNQESTVDAIINESSRNLPMVITSIAASVKGTVKFPQLSIASVLRLILSTSI